MRKIAFFTHEPRLSGGERSLLDILTNLKGYKKVLFLTEKESLYYSAEKRNIRTRIIKLKNKNILNIKRDEVNFITIFKFLFSFLGFVRSFFLAIEDEKPDFIYTNSQKAHILGVLSSLFYSTPVIIHFRDILPENFFIKKILYLEAKIAKKIICVSKAVRKKIPKIFEKKTRVVYNGIEIQEKENIISIRKETREKMGIKEEEIVIISASQIARWKGQKSLLQALCLLKDKGLTPLTFIIGAPLFKGEEEYEKELQNFVKEKNLSNVQFTGYIKFLFPILCAGDILVHTSVEPEPFGRIIIEGMSSFNCVIASKKGATPEIVKYGENGFLYEDVETLAEILKELIVNDDKREKIKEKSYEYVRKNFTLEKMVRGVEIILKGLDS